MHFSTIWIYWWQMQRFWKYKIDHVLFWLATVLFYSFGNTPLSRSAGPWHFLTDILIRNGLLASICYLNILWLFPKLFRPGKYFYYLFASIALLAVYTFTKNAYDVYLFGNVLDIEEQKAFFHNTYYNFSIALFYLIFSLTLDLSRKWYRQQLQLQQVQMEKLSTELNYLKAQINPHFLFNSINSIFFLIDRRNVKARESLHVFSEMLRYQLYDCSADTIPIQKEIRYLESYVALQKMRKNENDEVIFHADTGTVDFSIPPLLLIPFIENAFKHGMSATGEGSLVDISLSRQNGSMNLRVKNSVDKSRSRNGVGGIGLKNVQRRLELLYPQRHELKITDEKAIYIVDLKIHL